MSKELLAAYEQQKAAGASAEVLAPLEKMLRDAGVELDVSKSVPATDGVQMSVDEISQYVRTEIIAAETDSADIGLARAEHLSKQLEAVSKALVEDMTSGSFSSEKTYGITPFVAPTNEIDLSVERVMKALQSADINDTGAQREVLKSLGLDVEKAVGAEAVEWGDWPEDLAPPLAGEKTDEVDWANIGS